jgi:hypothetical protein
MNLYEKTISTGKFELKKPLPVDGKELTEIDFPITEIKGRDIVAAQDEYEVLTGGDTEGVLEMDKGFLAFMAAKVAKLPHETVLDMPVRDFNAITLVTQRFLFRGE